MPLAAEDLQRQRGQPVRQAGVGRQQAVVFVFQPLGRALFALVDFVEVLQRFVVVVGLEQFLALDAERLGNAQRLVRDPRVQASAAR